MEIVRNLPYANRGYVFKKKKLRKFFNSMWWYMPDSNYVPSTKDFTPREWRLIAGEKSRL
ncbi:MAG: YARHG domain-containing protein [Prevotella sp.]|nr:YARHG domain-containing protein [Prevotella sp.]